MTTAPVKKKKRGRPPKKKKKEEEVEVVEQPKPEYVKHLVECRCILPQFKNMEDPPYHKFIVFSELDEKAQVKPSFAQCNNCGIIHKVTEVSVSVTLKKEELRSLETIDDIELQIPEKIANLLRKHECELHVWQEAKFILDHGLWGRFIVLSKEREGEMIIGKICQILGNNLVKIENFERDESPILIK